MSEELSTKVLIQALSRAGLVDEREAEQTLLATVAVLGELLTEDERVSVGASFAEPLRRVLSSGPCRGRCGPVAVYERVRARTGADAIRSMEEVQVVLVALGSTLPDDALKLLRRALPDELAERMGPREIANPPMPSTSLWRGDTLATGRPGSRHPVSEAAPSGNAQEHSVVREANPHGDRKLSSGRTR